MHCLRERLAAAHRHPLVDRKRLHAKLRLLGRELAPCKPAGIADVVHDPHPHIAPPGLYDELLEKREVLRREVGLRHTATRLHRHRAESEALHPVEVARHALDRYRPVQPVVGLGPILRWRRFPCTRNLCSCRHLQPLPWLLRKRASAKQSGQKTHTTSNTPGRNHREQPRKSYTRGHKQGEILPPLKLATGTSKRQRTHRARSTSHPAVFLSALLAIADSHNGKRRNRLNRLSSFYKSQRPSNP
jgi:hypothetical protein